MFIPLLIGETPIMVSRHKGEKRIRNCSYRVISGNYIQ